MRVLASLLVLLAAPVLFAQGGLSVDVEPLVEGKAKPGQEYTMKLHFIVPDGYHAYHKDNPGYSLPVNVEWTSLAGLELVKEDWPEPHKKKDEISEEWELGPIFDIAYTFKVPSDATGTLTIGGSYEVQFCDAEGCYMSEGDFSAPIAVAASVAPPSPGPGLPGPKPAPNLPKVEADISFSGPAQPGGEAVLKWTFEFTEGYHLYHMDNPGYSLPPTFDWKELSGLKLKDTKWPEPIKHEIEEGWVEWEHANPLTIEFTFTVPEDVKGELPIKAAWTAQICDENACFDRKGEADATLTIATASAPINDATDDHGFYLDFEYALEKARKENKLLLVDFNGEN